MATLRQGTGVHVSVLCRIHRQNCAPHPRDCDFLVISPIVVTRRHNQPHRHRLPLNTRAVLLFGAVPLCHATALCSAAARSLAASHSNCWLANRTQHAHTGTKVNRACVSDCRSVMLMQLPSPFPLARSLGVLDLQAVRAGASHTVSSCDPSRHCAVTFTYTNNTNNSRY